MTVHQRNESLNILFSNTFSTVKSSSLEYVLKLLYPISARSTRSEMLDVTAHRCTDHHE